MIYPVDNFIHCFQQMDPGIQHGLQIQKLVMQLHLYTIAMQDWDLSMYWYSVNYIM